VELFAAMGHGRSYGIASSMLGRRLPSILSCGMWKGIESRPPVPTTALITDIGNDLLYEVPPEQVAEWVSETADRLLALTSRIAMTMLPTGNSSGLSEWRFLFLRNCFFPSCQLSLEELMRRAGKLDVMLREICAERGIRTIEQRREWYGFDPIHIKQRQSKAAWGEILSPWCDGERPVVPRPSRRGWLQFHLMVPEQRWFFGISQRREQPAGKLPDGSPVFLY
jgi:hypothetical protein